MLESLLSQYGYPIVFIGTFLEGETVMVLGGLAAHLDYLSLRWVIASGFGGTLVGDQLSFYLGRRHGKSLLVRYPSWQARATVVLDRFEQHQNLLILGFRFLYGLRSITPFALGLSGIAYPRFIMLNLIGAAVWATCIGLAGFYFGQAVEAVLGDIKRYELVLMAGIIAAAMLIWTIHYKRRRRSGRGTP
jgi:membrane protein DedA with SNARE-associated domain